jgi:uncharacterized protein YwgA
MSKKETNSNFDNLLYLYSVLKRLNCGEVDTFEQRITSQKTQYFAQLFGVSFRYNYNLYINGPYSPALAKDLFAIKEQKMKPMLNKFVPDDLEKRFTDLKKFIKDMDARKLEIVATYHWLLKVAKMDIKEAQSKLIELKKVNEKELQYSIDKIKKYGQTKESYK